MMKSISKKPLFIFDLANNHMGSLDHGLTAIRQIHDAVKEYFEVFEFGFKFQYRDLDTFIHPDYMGRDDIKYVKRFSETRLLDDQFATLKDEVEKCGFISICTPFDENSVDLMERQNFSILKIASCSFTDWPLLERVVQSDMPIIASTGGASLADIDKVVSFFQHREKQFALMHCVAEYPTPDNKLELNQIDLLAERYPEVPVGYSTHERTDNYDAVKIAVAKGARILEKHVAVPTDRWGINDYSATPQQVNRWIKSAAEAYSMCGISGERIQFSEKELSTLRSLGRGVWAKRNIPANEKVATEDIFYAIPVTDGQITANDMSKYSRHYPLKEVSTNQPLRRSELKTDRIRDKVYSIAKQVKEIFSDANVLIPGRADIEISHHYGLDRFDDYGAIIVNFINREYCKKLIVVLEGQSHPEQYHQKKEETFHILHGKMVLALDGTEKEYGRGDIVTVMRGVSHRFYGKTNAVIEEISSTHYKDDSFYTDPEIQKNTDRKTLLSYFLN